MEKLQEILNVLNHLKASWSFNMKHDDEDFEALKKEVIEFYKKSQAYDEIRSCYDYQTSAGVYTVNENVMAALEDKFREFDESEDE